MVSLKTALGLILALALVSGCAHYQKIAPGEKPALYSTSARKGLAARFAPFFLVHNFNQAHNRIARPVPRRAELDTVEIAMDPARPAVYFRITRFKTAKGAYTNLIYRVHFPATPLSLSPFFIGAGENMGILVVITLDEKQRPVLVTQAGTCGCYVTLIPTNYTPKDALPQGWNGRPQKIYGEELPARLDFGAHKNLRLVVAIRPGEHRVMNLTMVKERELIRVKGFQRIEAELIPADELTRLPLGRETVSLFYTAGPLKGHVRGAYKPLETLFLGLVSLDFFVGMDKAYGDPDNPLYTSLKPWARDDSNMNDFPRFLEYWGWRF